MKQEQSLYDVTFFSAFAVFGIVLWFSIPVLLPGESGFQVDTRLFPRVIAVLLFVVGLASAVASYVGSRGKIQESESSKEAEGHESAKILRVMGMIFIMFLYAFLAKSIGFLPTSFLAV
jgi:hypothetical protein